MGVDVVIDAATGPSPEEQAATAFFTAAARNLQEAGLRAGVEPDRRRLDRRRRPVRRRLRRGEGRPRGADAGGPVPALVLRATQFHEFVEQLVEWGRQGDVSYVPKMRTQLVAARTAAEAVVALIDAETRSARSPRSPGRGRRASSQPRAARRANGQAPADRGRQRPGPRRGLRVRRAAARARRDARGPDVRGVARGDVRGGTGRLAPDELRELVCAVGGGDR